MGARSLTRLALRDRANARGRKCTKWRQAHWEGRRVMPQIRGPGRLSLHMATAVGTLRAVKSGWGRL